MRAQTAKRCALNDRQLGSVLRVATRSSPAGHAGQVENLWSKERHPVLGSTQVRFHGAYHFLRGHNAEGWQLSALIASAEIGKLGLLVTSAARVLPRALAVAAGLSSGDTTSHSRWSNLRARGNTVSESGLGQFTCRGLRSACASLSQPATAMSAAIPGRMRQLVAWCFLFGLWSASMIYGIVGAPMHDLTFGILHWTLAATGVWLITGTLLNFSSDPHWYIRGWDFPRVLTAALAAIVAAAWAWTCDWRWWDAVFLASLAGVVGIQVWNIYPYTSLARQQVLCTERTGHAATSIRLVATNVLMENRAFEKWREVVRAADPDVILAVEIDDMWMERAVRPLVADWPHVVAEPRDNHYGMVLLSRLELVNPEVRHQVQADVPSIHCGVRLKSGDVINLRSLHPRPPEPLDNQDSAPRDAELVLVGRAIGDDPTDPPTIVTGDLNDVAWSHTTRLFLRLSGLLDPRIGRGFFNSYNAKNPLFRFPLDHFFHSNDFRLIDLRRLDYVGSDHFPMYLALSYEPAREQEQPKPEEDPDDREQADEMVERT